MENHIVSCQYANLLVNIKPAPFAYKYYLQNKGLHMPKYQIFTYGLFSY